MGVTGQRTIVHHKVLHEVVQVIRPDREAAQQLLFNRREDTYLGKQQDQNIDATPERHNSTRRTDEI